MMLRLPAIGFGGASPSLSLHRLMQGDGRSSPLGIAHAC
jgi:hypothetical protein